MCEGESYRLRLYRITDEDLVFDWPVRVARGFSVLEGLLPPLVGGQSEVLEEVFGRFEKEVKLLSRWQVPLEAWSARSSHPTPTPEQNFDILGA